VRLLLIVNASAASVTARARVVIHKALAADHDVTVAETSRRGHATRLAQGAAAAGTEAVIVLGGDGTLNEAANGLVGTSTALGVLPGGSTNVFARTIGMTNDPIEATGELLAALARNAIRPVNLGSVNGRYFLFNVGLGFDAAVVATVERRSALKRYLGAALFVYGAFATWFRHYDRHHPHFRADVRTHDGATHSINDGYFGICLNTDPYTFLGERPLHVAPGTSLDTRLALVAFETLGLATILRLAADGLRRSDRAGTRMARQRKVTVLHDVEELVVYRRSAADAPARAQLPYQVDGDYLGEADRLQFRSEPDALRLIVP
jgi:diacylglycerol kinase family enzyme